MLTVRVYHDYYGCESGCCGHTVEIEQPDGGTKSEFSFTHNYRREKTPDSEWARALAEKVIAKEWPECLDSIDWASLQFEVSDD